MEEKEVTAQHQEEENIGYYRKLLFVNKVINLFHIVLFGILSFIVINLLDNETIWFVNLVIFFISSFLFFVLGWIFTFPLRVITYFLCKKQGTLKQKFLSWSFDWIKNLLTCLLTYVPFFSISLTLLHNFYLNNRIFFIIGIVVFLVFSVLVVNLQKTIALCLIHGVYLLKDGEYYSYWSNIAIANKLKVYPVFVLKIKEKAKWANAIAFGIKDYGFIYTSDVLLEDTSKEQFAAIMAHETGHIENYDYLERFFPLLGFVFIGSIFFILVGFIGVFEIIVLFFAFIIGVFAIMIATTKFYQDQEYIADQFAKDIIGDGRSLAEALGYIYKINKMPITPKKLFGRNICFHPSLEARIERLLEGDNV